MTNITQVPKKELTAIDYLMTEPFKNSLRDALPRHLTPERMACIALTELRRNPKLLECDPLSFIGSVVQCAQLGLEPGLLGHSYFVPYKKECQLLIGYKGMIDLARRSGQVITLQAHVVYENDDFEFEYGLNPKLRHVPSRSNRGQIIYTYACATLKDGGSQFEVMSIEDIIKIKSLARKGEFDKQFIWNNHFDEMARKTAVRRLFKYLPVSIELSRAISIDESAEYGTQNNALIFDHEFESLENPSIEETKTDKMINILDTKQENLNELKERNHHARN